MPVIKNTLPPVPPHLNPPLRTGEVYRVISATAYYADKVGDCFTYVVQSGLIVWLAYPGYVGGFDTSDVISKRGIKFEVCTLQQL